MWLNEQGLDIRCVRIKPYAYNGRVLVDVQQIIPLPEAAEYVVGIKKKQERNREARDSSRDYTRYDVTVGGATYSRLNKRMAIFRVVRYLCDSGVPPEAIIRVNDKLARWRSVDADVHSSEEFIARQKALEDAGGKSFDSSRFFCDDDLIHSGGKTWVFSNQWGKRVPEYIDELKKTFPDKQIACSPSA
jgi:hypothetical protein